jgi:hypothetical protein
MRVSRKYAVGIISSALLVISLALGMLWQWQGRAHQRLDIGTPFDDGAVLNFHAAETSAANSSLSFRWSKDASELRLWAFRSDIPAVLTIHMFPPAGASRSVTLAVGGQKLGDVTLGSGMREYRMLLRVPTNREIAIDITSDPQTHAGDSRALAVGIDQIALDELSGPSIFDLVRELWSAPLLPAGLLLIALCALLLRLPTLLIGGLAALTLGALVLLDQLLPAARLRMASYPFAIGITVVTALVLIALLQRRPRLWPNSDAQAVRWIMILFVVTVVLAFTPTVKSDGVGYYVYLHSIMMDGDLNFGNDYRDWPDQKSPNEYLTTQTATGYYLNLFSIGPAILWSPLYGAAHVIMLGGQALGLPWRADGYAQPYFVLTTFASALAGLVMLFGGYRICRRWVGPPTALLAVVTVFLGSNLLYYTMREGGFAHALSAATATIYVLAWLRLEEHPSVRRWAELGAAAGLMVVTYWISAIVLLLPMFTFARLLISALRASPRRRGPQIGRLLLGAGLAAALLALIFSPQMIAWKSIFGSFLTIPQGAGFVTPRAFKGVEMLFAPLHGLLPWTPALFFGMFSLTLLWGRSRYLTITLLVALLAYFLYNAWLPDWHGSGAFGLRRLTLLGPWCMLGLALLFDLLRRWRRLLPAVPAVLMIAWTTFVLIRYDLDLVPHSPGDLRKLSPVSFYLSREIFPLWAVPGWINNNYIVRQVRDMFSGGWNGQFVAIAIIMIAATWTIARLSTRPFVAARGCGPGG